MFSAWFLTLVALVYVGILFGVAWFGDRYRGPGLNPRLQAVIYSLSLAVYCTSWTFYGAVGTASTGGWNFLPIYLGPALVFVFGFDLLRRIVRVSKQRNITSVADLIASRFGRSATVAVVVTLIAVIGGIPYIALQLKAINLGLSVLTDRFVIDPTLYVAAFLALFAILFGTRDIDATEHHRGMIWAIALESMVKLVAFVAIGLFALFALGGMPAISHAIAADPELSRRFAVIPPPDGFLTATVLSMAAIICLPRQFHVTVVEYNESRDLHYARWIFPLYLALISFFVIPIAVAGALTLGSGVNPDTYVLALPAAAGQGGLSILSLLGGFSAATGMVIVATVALATMVSNDMVLPAWLRLRRSAAQGEMSRRLLLVRRAVIVLIVAAAWAYQHWFTSAEALAAIGLLAFSAVAQFAPALVVGMYWNGASRRGALAGLVGGLCVWSYTLLLPALTPDSHPLIAAGPLGIPWLRPEALFGIQADPLSHGVWWSLLVNLGLLLAVSLSRGQSLGERLEANAFTRRAQPVPARSVPKPLATIGDLEDLAARFVGERNMRLAFRDQLGAAGERRRSEQADTHAIQFTERLLSGAIGSAAARSVMAGALRRRGMADDDVVQLLTDASQVVRFNRRLLEATLDSLPQGVSVVDGEMNIVGWNRAYLELFEYPPGMVYVGRPVADLIRHNAELGRCGFGTTEEHVAKRLSYMRRGSAYQFERSWPSGRVLEMRGRPMPGGGFVTTFTDITEQKRTEQALKNSEAQVRMYTDNAPALLAYVDADLRYRFANRAYCETLGVSGEALLGRRVGDVLSAAELMKRTGYIEGALQGERQVFELELAGDRLAPIYALGTYIPDIEENGVVRGFFAVFQDITSRRLAELALREVNETLEQRVVERTRELVDAVEAVEAARADAEAANTAKTRFLAAASHDLLQPLNAARLFASVLAQRVGQMHPEDGRMVEQLDASLNAAEELLTALLEISKLDRGALTPRVEAFPVEKLFDRIERQFLPLAREAGLQLRVRRCSQTVASDPQWLRRVVQNFVANAMRYTDSGGVLIGCRSGAGCLRIGVWDTGPGIAEADQELIFGEFQRLEVRRARGQKGLGLGLAISRRMAEMLGHPIGVRSRVGRGSCFWVEVPLAPAASITPTGRPRELPRRALGALNVLVIENDARIIAGMEALLGRWGCRTRCAADVVEALALIEQGFRPDVVLADYHLDHGENGIDAALDVRVALQHEIPVILISADRSEDLGQSAGRQGFHLLQKPVRPAKLRALLARLTLPRPAPSPEL